MTLRERLVALANDQCCDEYGFGYADLCDIALSAARLALEDAAAKADKPTTENAP